MVLSEMLGAHVRGKCDAEANIGIRYAWLSDRQALAVSDAMHALASMVADELEELRERCTEKAQ
jgi:hypothetical protein